MLVKKPISSRLSHSTHGGDPPVICGEAAGCGQSLSGAPETVRSGSLTPGTAHGAAGIEFFEFDPLVTAWRLNHALMRGLAFCESRRVLQSQPRRAYSYASRAALSARAAAAAAS